MPAHVMEWLNLVFRWAHVFAAILWVGSTYYFTWLDGQMRRMESSGAKGGVWMVHSGGFYTVVKQKALGVAPGEIHWFRWEAMVTWLSGFSLLTILPAAAAAMAISAWVSFGLAMSIRSMSSRATSARQSVSVDS